MPLLLLLLLLLLFKRTAQVQTLPNPSLPSQAAHLANSLHLLQRKSSRRSILETPMEFCGAITPPSEEEMDLRRGPWTVEEDLLLMNYIAANGEGKWNCLARRAGLRRTGKSCRLRWLNYLRPDVRRGNITPEEQLLILELHSRWGNRWSKIAQFLPGRTDNEIKNYWRTRVQKHAKQLKCDVNSKQFKDVMRYLWMPRLVERIRSASSAAAYENAVIPLPYDLPEADLQAAEAKVLSPQNSSSTAGSSASSSITDSFGVQFSPPPVSGACMQAAAEDSSGDVQAHPGGEFWSDSLPCAGVHPELSLPDFDQIMWGDQINMWSMEDIWLQHQF